MNDKFSRILQEAVNNATSNTADSDLTGPVAAHNTTYTPLPDDEPVDDGSGTTTFLLILLIIIIIGGLATFAYFAYNKVRMQQLVDEYENNPEAQIQKKTLNVSEKKNLAEWTINPEDNEKFASAATSEKVEVGGESYFQIRFSDVKGRTSITTNQGLERNRDTVYFEVEIGELLPTTKVAVGLAGKDNFDKTKFPGETKDSVGINLFDGTVSVNGQVVYDYGFKADFGDTIGIGYTFDTKKVWFFYNGKFLNDPRIGSPQKGFKNPYEKENPEAIEKAQAEREKKNVVLDRPISYYPVIGSDADCLLLLNVGGAIFKNDIPEMAAGLL